MRRNALTKLTRDYKDSLGHRPTQECSYSLVPFCPYMDLEDHCSLLSMLCLYNLPFHKPNDVNTLTIQLIQNARHQNYF